MYKIRALATSMIIISMFSLRAEGSVGTDRALARMAEEGMNITFIPGGIILIIALLVLILKKKR